MSHSKFWVFALSLCLLLGLSGFAQQGRDPDSRDVRGISPQHFKYLFSAVGGAAVGAGLGFILPGEKTPLKLALIGGGGASTWFLNSHNSELGQFHDYAMMGSNALLGTGVGWLACNCRDGGFGGALIGGGATAVWEALKNDRAARNTFNRAAARIPNQFLDRPPERPMRSRHKGD